MAHTSAPTALTRSGSLGTPVPRRSPCAKRRRVLILALLLVVVGLAAVANYGPVRAYRDAQARLQETSAEVAALETQKFELQAQLGKLSEAGYLESLARQELTYARPGEDLYIITGAESANTGTDSIATESTEATSPEPAEEPGLLERFLSALGGLF